MPSKQIHELPPTTAVDPADQLIVSRSAGNVTRRAAVAALPYVAPRTGATPRTLTARLGDTVSVRDFGAVGDGVADDTAAVAAAVASGAGEVRLPPGTYRLTAPVLVGAGIRLAGAGRHVTRLHVDHGGVGLDVAAGEVVQATIEGLGLKLGTNAAGIRIKGNESHLRDLFFSGGAATKWAIELIDANIVHVMNVAMGGNGAAQFTANGILWRNSNPAQNAVNYGDGTIQGLDIKLGAANTTGIHLLGEQTRLINNVMIAKAQIIAPLSGITPYPGTVAIRLDSCARCTLLSVDIEAIAKGVVEAGISNGLGASLGNQYVGVYCINVPVAYEDSNATVARSVQQRTFIGCDNFPMTGALGDGDTLLPAGLFWSAYNDGTPAVCLRSFKADVALLTPDGTANVERPQKGLMIEVSSANITRIGRPQGQTTNANSRLELGNGPAYADGGLRDVTIKDPLRLEARAAALNAPTNGHMVYVESNAASVVPSAVYDGPGLYMLVKRASSATGDWKKIVSNPN